MSMERKIYKVFISSTYLDNQERRKVVEDAVLRAEMLPVGMERFTASTHPTVEECERYARDCDVYVGIIAHRYGWIPDGKKVSITELEYDAAEAAERVRLMFEIDDSVPIDQRTDYDEGSDRWDKQKQLTQFKAKYQGFLAAKFTENRLSGMVVQALNQWRDEHEGKKPESTAARPDTVAATQEIDRYCQAVESLHGRIVLAGFKTKLRVPIDLEDLYVPLQAIVDLRGTGDSVFADASDAEAKLRAQGSQEISLMEAFRDAKKRKRRAVVILGDPGSGKTTHLERLLLACLGQGPESLGLPAGTLPVFLPLRELEDLSKGIDAFIEQSLDDDPHMKMSTGFGAHLLNRGHLLLLFDGLDEVSDPKEREKVARWLERAARARPNCTLVVTCRFAGYDDVTQLNPDFLQLHLCPLTPRQSEIFIHNWYRAVETGLARDPDQGAITAQQRAEELVERLRAPDFRSARMAEMTRNPLLLANLCLVHRDRHTLPHGRHELYDECIEVLLERWREDKPLAVNVSAKDGRRVLQPAALWMHSEEGRTRASARELAPELTLALQAVQWRGGDAHAFLRTVRDESGLLTGWGPDHYGFMHLGFQEYLAACELRRLAFKGDKGAVLGLASHYGESWWQEVILMLLAQGNPSLFTPFMRQALCHPRFGEATDLLGLILEEAAEVSVAPFVELLQQPPGEDPRHWARQLTALQVLERLRADAELDTLAKSLRQHPFGEVKALAQARAQAAIRPTRITQLGGVELVLIPRGTFHMGSPASDAEGYENERPEHDVQVPTFYLGRHPVTNEQYGRFLNANADVEEPKYWGDRRFNQARQPVVGVPWYDARRFAQWAGGRLPTEAEWEYAARAGTTTRYWWGDEVGKNNANCADCGSQWDRKQTTAPVGSFPPNPFGLYDMLGTVWEWVKDSWHDSYKGAPTDGKAWSKGDMRARRVIRGGSWGNVPRNVRSANRSGSPHGNRSYGVGFRLAQDI